MRYSFRFPRRDFARGLLGNFLALEIRGRRECRTLGASAAACAVVESTRVSHHGHAGNVRHSPRNGFNGFLRALPGDRAFLPPSPPRSLLLGNLTPASGRQDHTTSPSASAPSSEAPSASTASRPTSVTIAKRPSCGTGRRRDIEVIWVGAKRNIFQKGLDSGVAKQPVGQISRPVRRSSKSEGGEGVIRHLNALTPDYAVAESTTGCYRQRPHMASRTRGILPLPSRGDPPRGSIARPQAREAGHSPSRATGRRGFPDAAVHCLSGSQPLQAAAITSRKIRHRDVAETQRCHRGDDLSVARRMSDTHDKSLNFGRTPIQSRQSRLSCRVN